MEIASEIAKCVSSSSLSDHYDTLHYLVLTSIITLEKYSYSDPGQVTPNPKISTNTVTTITTAPTITTAITMWEGKGLCCRIRQ